MRVSEVKLTEIELIIAPKGASDANKNTALGLQKILKKWCDKFWIILQIDYFMCEFQLLKFQVVIEYLNYIFRNFAMT